MDDPANGKGTWPGGGHVLTGPELAALCKASGHSLPSFARLIGIDGRKLHAKCPIDFSEDIMAAAAIDQMRKEAVEPPASP